MTDDSFYLMVGLAATAILLLVPTYFALKKFFGIDMRIYFFAAQADFIGMWYDRKEQREAAIGRRRSP